MTRARVSFRPRDYRQLIRIAEKLQQFRAEDFAVYRLLAIRATDDLDLFEQSVDMYLARREELAQAMEAQQQASTTELTLRDALDASWQGLDESAIGGMSADDRHALARRMTAELTEAQLQYMRDHPGETLQGFAETATLMNTPETFSAIGDDLAEAASGDANGWARFAAGVGAGAKMSGWLLAAGSLLYVASWLTGIGELATIAAAVGILLGSTLTLSLAESELRIQAASEATTPQEFKRNVEAAAAARTNVIVGVALLMVAAVLHFTARAFFPRTMQNIRRSLQSFRERVRLRGSIHELKPRITQEMATRRAEMVEASELAKRNALDAANELEGTTLEQFVDRLEHGDGGFLDPSRVPPDQILNFRELLTTSEGRAAIEGYKQRLIDALRTDVIAEIDRLTQEYTTRIDEFVREIEAARTHDDMNAAADRLDQTLTEDHARRFVQGAQERIIRQNVEEAATEARQEVLQGARDAIVERVERRIAARSGTFRLTYTAAELDAIFRRGRELGLSDRMIEDMIYTGSREAKRISAVELMQQMENYNAVRGRGYPYRFRDLAEFQRFSDDLIAAVRQAGLPTSDIRIQGSSLRTPRAADVDIAVFVEESLFDQMLVNRFHNRAAFSSNAPSTPGARISLQGRSHAELLALAREITANESHYNNQAQTFARAMVNGIFNSKSDISMPLKAAAARVAGDYPSLNIETISALVRGGAFENTPDMQINPSRR
jgi:hypothetical protein